MRGRIKDAVIVDGEFRELSTASACGMAGTCIGAVRIRIAMTEVDIHLCESERVALIRALGGVDTLGPA